MTDLREIVARAICDAWERGGDMWWTYATDAAIALIWPAAMREAAEAAKRQCERDDLPISQGWAIQDAILSLFSPDAEKEEGR